MPNTCTHTWYIFESNSWENISQITIDIWIAFSSVSLLESTHCFREAFLSRINTTTSTFLCGQCVLPYRMQLLLLQDQLLYWSCCWTCLLRFLQIFSRERNQDIEESKKWSSKSLDSKFRNYFGNSIDFGIQAKTRCIFN